MVRQLKENIGIRVQKQLMTVPMAEEVSFVESSLKEPSSRLRCSNQDPVEVIDNRTSSSKRERDDDKFNAPFTKNSLCPTESHAESRMKTEGVALDPVGVLSGKVGSQCHGASVNSSDLELAGSTFDYFMMPNSVYLMAKWSGKVT